MAMKADTRDIAPPGGETVEEAGCNRVIKDHRDNIPIKDVNAAIGHFLVESGQSFTDDYQ
jgi:hypothetical protein